MFVVYLKMLLCEVIFPSPEKISAKRKVQHNPISDFGVDFVNFALSLSPPHPVMWTEKRESDRISMSHCRFLSP